jgi:indole-3-acetate monooxygenase
MGFVQAVHFEGHRLHRDGHEDRVRAGPEHDDLAAADALLRGARAGLLEILDECWDLAHSGEPIDRALQARAFLAAQHGSDVAVETCATAHRLGGGAAAYRTNPLLRALRDVQTARQHAMFNRGLRPHLGRTIAGSDEAHPPFVV